MANLSLATAYTLSILDITANNGEKYDIRGLMSEMHIYEDINNSFVYGSMRILDTGGLFTHLGLQGGEKLDIEFNSAGEEDSDDHIAKFEFIVIAVNGIVQEGQSKYAYSISFSTEIAHRLTHEKVSHYYKDKKTVDIFKQILTDTGYKGDFEASDSIYPMSITFPNCTKKHALDYLCNKSVDVNHPSNAGYTYFQNKNGIFFKSYSDIVNSKTVEELYYVPAIVDGKSQYARNRIRSIHSDKGWDISRASMSGIESNTITVINPSTRTTKTTNTTKDTVKWIREGKQSKRKNVIPRTMNLIENNNMYPNHINLRRSEWMPISDIERAKLNQFSFTINLPGDSSRMVGTVINLNMQMSKTPGSDEFVDSKFYSGRYIIGKIHHSFTRDDYDITAEILRFDLPDK